MKKLREKYKETKLFLFFFAIFAIVTAIINICFYNHISHYVLIIINLFIAFVFVIFVCIQMAKKKNDMLKKEIAFLKMEAELLNCYYEPLEYRRDEIKKYCHDARNIMNIISDKAAYSPCNNQLEQMAAEFIENGEKLVCKEYCENKLVNSIISKKKDEAGKIGAEFYCNIVIPDALGIDPMDVCSCFFNILDNAIHANNVSTDQPKWISIKSNLVGSYLVIKMENTYFDIGKGNHQIKDRAFHGLGLEIIRDIAKRNNGAVETARENDCFYTVISLQVKNI